MDAKLFWDSFLSSRNVAYMDSYTHYLALRSKSIQA